MDRKFLRVIIGGLPRNGGMRPFAGRKRSACSGVAGGRRGAKATRAVDAERERRVRMPANKFQFVWPGEETGNVVT
jgi:hypothetical protein